MKKRSFIKYSNSLMLLAILTGSLLIIASCGGGGGGGTATSLPTYNADGMWNVKYIVAKNSCGGPVGGIGYEVWKINHPVGSNSLTIENPSWVGALKCSISDVTISYFGSIFPYLSSCNSTTANLNLTMDSSTSFNGSMDWAGNCSGNSCSGAYWYIATKY